MTQTDWLLDSLERRGSWTRAEAARAFDATSRALHRRLPSHAAERFARDLPWKLAARLGEPDSEAEPTLDAVYSEVQREEDVERGQAMEHVQIVCAVLGHVLPRETRDWVQRELPDCAHLFDSSPPRSEPPTRLGRSPTLAEGRPGSGQPLSEAAPGSQRPLSEGHPDRTQQNAVREPNPHAESKVSSSKGLTQEREHETLSEGRSKTP